MTASNPFADLLSRQPASAAAPQAAAWMQDIESATFATLRAGTAAHATAHLDQACRRWPDATRLHWLHALLLREDQAHEAALDAATRAADAALTAQLRYETGRPAATHFAAARTAAPGDTALIRGHAGALAAEGQGDDALALIARETAARPDWVEGHAYHATLARLLGADANAIFAQAVQAQPHNLALRLNWFHWLARLRDWPAARAVLADATRAFGDTQALIIARLYLIAESGEGDDQPDLFAPVADNPDAGLSLARVRHALRCHAPDHAAAIAQAQLATPAASLFWPYLSLCWRLLGDDRAHWLDRPDAFIRTIDLDLDCAALVNLLRSLHTAAAPYPDQSVRGGTQTDRPLLFRHEPEIAQARAAIEAAVRDYVAALPPPEPGHPLLNTPRNDLKFAGSWSVRLTRQGHHAVHTHPAGWISSALHVALPDAAAMGAAPAGWLRFGAPPPDLGLTLTPYRQIAPKVARLVLFPSTLWHDTIPFTEGERLSLAFDIRPPRF
ncbi:MAG: putative 2OG-Fe(II) oxygenase [Pseudomonadota bacterium]